MTDPEQTIEGVRITRLKKNLAEVIIQPGITVPPLGDTKSVNVLVKDGAVRVSISAGNGEVLKGSGEPIRSGDGDSVFCESAKCALNVGDSAVLTAGNSCFVRDGELTLKAVGDQAAELHMGAQVNGGGKREKESLPEGASAFAAKGGGGGGSVTPLRCWLCPFM